MARATKTVCGNQRAKPHASGPTKQTKSAAIPGVQAKQSFVKHSGHSMLTRARAKEGPKKALQQQSSSFTDSRSHHGIIENRAESDIDVNPGGLPKDIRTLDPSNLSQSSFDFCGNTAQFDKSLGAADRESLDVFLDRLNSHISKDISSQKLHTGGYMSFLKGPDPRLQVPASEEEISALRLAIRPSTIHFAEITGYEPHMDDSTPYLTQILELQTRLERAWAINHPLDLIPTLYQLEPWAGSILDWRQSQFSNGERQISVSRVLNEMSAMETTALQPEDCGDTSTQELPPTPFPEQRPTMFPIYDSDRDLGFLPMNSEIENYQRGQGTIGTPEPQRTSRDVEKFSYKDDWPRRHKSFQIFVDPENLTPPPSSDPPDAAPDDSMEDSDKENDHSLAPVQNTPQARAPLSPFEDHTSYAHDQAGGTPEGHEEDADHTILRRF